MAALRRDCSALRASNLEKDDVIRSNEDDLKLLADLRRDCSALRASNLEKDGIIRTNDGDLKLLMDFAIMSWGRERLVTALQSFKRQQSSKKS